MEKRLQVYRYIILGLVLINAALIVFAWVGKPLRPPRPEQILRKELHLTDEQMTAYRVLIADHRKEIEPLESQMRQLKKSLFTFTTTDSAALRQLTDHIGHVQSQMDLSTFQHFQLVRALCTEEQKEKFNDVLERALRPKAGPPGKD